MILCATLTFLLLLSIIVVAGYALEDKQQQQRDLYNFHCYVESIKCRYERELREGLEYEANMLEEREKRYEL